jgi:N-hydroxyarylamine O-acetyltransferase
MDAAAIAAYLDRIGMNRPAVLDAAVLGALHLAHQRTVPFENLSIHLSEPISLDEAGLIAKIITRRRGGFCYELNGGFALLLEGLGAQVRRVAARVYGGGQLGPLFDHLALVVHLPRRGRRRVTATGYRSGTGAAPSGTSRWSCVIRDKG